MMREARVPGCGQRETPCRCCSETDGGSEGERAPQWPHYTVHGGMASNVSRRGRKKRGREVVMEAKKDDLIGPQVDEVRTRVPSGTPSVEVYSCNHTPVLVDKHKVGTRLVGKT